MHASASVTQGSNATVSQQHNSTRPWYKCLLVCCAGAQTPVDVIDPYEQRQSHHNHEQQPVQDAQRSSTLQAIPPAGGSSSSSAAKANPADAAAGTRSALPAPVPPAAAPTATVPDTVYMPKAAVPQAVGATRALLDDDSFDIPQDASSSGTHHAFESSSTPIGGLGRLRGLGTPTAAAAAAAAARAGAEGGKVGGSSSSIVEPVPTAATVSGTMPSGDHEAAQVLHDDVAATKDSGAAASHDALRDAAWQMQQQQRHSAQHSPAYTPGSMSPARSPMKASPFTNKEMQGLVAAELIKHRQHRQQQEDQQRQQQQQQQQWADEQAVAVQHQQQQPGVACPGVDGFEIQAQQDSRQYHLAPLFSRDMTGQQGAAGAAAAPFDTNVDMNVAAAVQRAAAAAAAARHAVGAAEGELQATALLDSSRLPALPAGLRIKTGRTSKAGSDALPAAAAAAAAAGGGGGGGISKPITQAEWQQQQDRQQQDRQFSLQHWGSLVAGPIEEADAASAAAAAAAAASSAAGLRGDLHAASGQQAEPGPPGSPRNSMHGYTSKLPPKSPIPQSASADTVPSRDVSSSSSTGFNFSSGGMNSAGQNWASAVPGSPLLSDSSGNHSHYYTAPGFVRTKPSVAGMGQLDLGAGVASDHFDSGAPGTGAITVPSAAAAAGAAGEGRSRAAGTSGAATSAPGLLQQDSDVTGSSPFEHQLFTQRHQHQLQDREEQQQQLSSQSEEGEEWDVVPVVLTPLRIPSQVERQQGDAEITPPSPKASVVGVSNSVINDMLSEDGIPLVPTGSYADGDTGGYWEPSAATPRPSMHGSFSSSFSGRQLPAISTPRGSFSSSGVPNLASAQPPSTPRGRPIGAASAAVASGVGNGSAPGLPRPYKATLGDAGSSSTHGRQRRLSGSSLSTYRRVSSDVGRRRSSSRSRYAVNGSQLGGQGVRSFPLQQSSSSEEEESGGQGRYVRRTISATGRPQGGLVSRGTSSTGQGAHGANSAATAGPVGNSASAGAAARRLLGPAPANTGSSAAAPVQQLGSDSTGRGAAWSAGRSAQFGPDDAVAVPGSSVDSNAAANAAAGVGAGAGGAAVSSRNVPNALEPISAAGGVGLPSQPGNSSSSSNNIGSGADGSVGRYRDTAALHGTSIYSMVSGRDTSSSSATGPSVQQQAAVTAGSAMLANFAPAGTSAYSVIESGAWGQPEGRDGGAKSLRASAEGSIGGPAGVVFTKLRDSQVGSTASNASGAAGVGSSSMSESLSSPGVAANTSSMLNTTGGNLAGSGALFSRTGWAVLKEPRGSSQRVQSLVAAE